MPIVLSKNVVYKPIAFNSTDLLLYDDPEDITFIGLEDKSALVLSVIKKNVFSIRRLFPSRLKSTRKRPSALNCV